MEKHITLVGTLNIAYRSLVLLLALAILLFMGWICKSICAHMYWGGQGINDVPVDVVRFITIAFFALILISITASVAGIIGGIGVLQRKSWGRITLLVVSFLNLLHIPVGTALGVYSIWVLMNDETIRLMDQRTIPPVMDRHS